MSRLLDLTPSSLPLCHFPHLSLAGVTCASSLPSNPVLHGPLASMSGYTSYLIIFLTSGREECSRDARLRADLLEELVKCEACSQPSLVSSCLPQFAVT